MREDLDAPRALRILRSLEQDDGVEPAVRAATFAAVEDLLGLALTRDIGRRTALPPAVTELLSARSTARAERNWALADALRAEIAAAGFIVRDTPAGQEVEPAP